MAVGGILVLAVVALFGARIAPFEPIYFVLEHGNDPRPYDPGLVFPFGSDVLGRDLLSLVLAGARTTLAIVLLAGLARSGAGVLIAALASWWRPTRLLTETLADLVAAVPATLVAVLLIKAFVKTDTSVSIMIGALLLVGWAGPYRVIRAEVDRLARAQFTEGARTMGATRWRLFWRHHLPHLAPVLATNLSQQVVASLVLVAELGVLGVIVSPVRVIDVEESLSHVLIGPPNSALIPDVPEWGAMLSTARTTEILWATRWVIFVPGAAFALTAMTVALVGFAIARRYARRDVFKDLRGAGFLAVGLAALAITSALLPERYADAREWAATARSGVHADTDTRSAFTAAGLDVHAVERRTTTIVRSGPATVRVGAATIAEPFPLPEVQPRSAASAAGPVIHARSLLSGGLGGGGLVDAPLVFAARGISPADVPQPPPYAIQRLGAALGPLLKDYPDDYGDIDVRGKVVVLVRFMGIDLRTRGFIDGTSPGTAIEDAVARGAAAVIFIDPYVASPGSSLYPHSLLGLNTYDAMERQFPALGVAGVPVVIVDREAAHTLFAPLGLEIDPLLGYDELGSKPERSPSRALGVAARVEVPLRADVSVATSFVGEVPGFMESAGRVVVWADHLNGTGQTEENRRDVLGALARFAAARRAPFIFVDFDPHADADAVRAYLRTRRVLLVIVLDRLDRSVFTFDTANGDVIPAFDLYAERAGIPHEPTRRTLTIEQVGSPMPELKTVMVDTIGDAGDPRADATALIGYLAGRLALGAPELGR